MTTHSLQRLALIAALSVAASAPAHAFCVYNDASEAPARFGAFPVHLPQPAKFVANVPGGERACCNWQEKSCNKSEQRTGLITMYASYNFSMVPFGALDGFVCSTDPKVDRGFAMEAGGWARVALSPNKDAATLTVYNVNKSVRTNINCRPTFNN
jgi:hypothetical protein